MPGEAPLATFGTEAAMATREPEIPHTQTSAPVEAPGTTEDATAGRRQQGAPAEERWPAAERGDPTGERADRMPRGADEPGAGL